MANFVLTNNEDVDNAESPHARIEIDGIEVKTLAPGSCFSFEVGDNQTATVTPVMVSPPTE